MNVEATNRVRFAALSALLVTVLTLVLLLLASNAGATITGDYPPPMGDWTINNPTTVIDDTVWIYDGNVTINSRLTVYNSTVHLEPLMYWDYYDFNVTAAGSLDANESLFTSWYSYIEYNFMGPVDMKECTLEWAWGGVTVTDSLVRLTDTKIDAAVNMGLTVTNTANPRFDNVSVNVVGGTNYVKTVTDRAWPSEAPLTVAAPVGIWVESGNPSFRDVTVRSTAYADFTVEYTGTEAEPRIYMNAVACVVLVQSQQVSALEGITVTGGGLRLYTHFDATDPGPNPYRFYGYMYGMSVGIAVMNYDDVTVTNVDVSGVYLSYVRSYTNGGTYNYAYAYYNAEFKIASGIMGSFSSNISPSFTLKDMTVTDGSGLLGHLFLADWTGAGDPSFSDTVVVSNIEVIGSSSYMPVISTLMTWAYEGVRSLDVDFVVSGSTFTGLRCPILDYEFVPGNVLDPNSKTLDIDESIRFTNNTVNHTATDEFFIFVEGIWSTHTNDAWDRTVVIADNHFQDFIGHCWDIYGIEAFVPGDESIHIINNVFSNISSYPGYDGPYYTEYFEEVLFKGNTLLDMQYGETGDFYDMGGDSNGLKPDMWRFTENTVVNCFNERYMEVLCLDYGGDVLIDNNTISYCNGFVSMWHNPEYVGPCTYTVADNEFFNNTAYMVEFGRSDDGQKSLTMNIINNWAYNNEDFFVNYWGSSNIDKFDNDATFFVDGNTFQNYTGGCLHMWGDVTISNNNFWDNQGPVALVDYINLHVPVLQGNDLNNNHDIYRFVAKDRGYQLVAMEFADSQMSCTGTALSFRNMEVSLTNVDITTTGTAIYAYNSFVDAISSEIDGSKCTLVSDGHIMTWWPMEVYVTWADANGDDSMKPTSEALVVFYDGMGSYYTSAYADEMGMLAEDLYPQWMVDLDGLAMYSPYTVKVAAAGATNLTDVFLDSALTGANMVHILLWDTYEPIAAITDPFNGEMLPVDFFNALGFVAEVGSGLDMVNYSIDGGNSWPQLDLMTGGDFSEALSGLPDGDVTFWIRATDKAGNENVTSITVTIDTTPPELAASPPSEITNQSVVPLTGTCEDGAHLYINGMFRRVMEGNTLSEDVLLHEGLNIILLEAYDDAGNMAMTTVQVTLDTLPPILVVTSPEDGLLTNVDEVTITGVVAGATTLTVNDAQVTDIDEYGMFTFTLSDLDEGEVPVIVKAIDEAGNEIMVQKTVHLDTTPPSAAIDSPEDGTHVMQPRVDVTVSADDDTMLWLNGRMLSSDVMTRTVLLLEGENTIHLKAVDMAGNINEKTITVILDTRGPVLKITDPVAEEVWTSLTTITIKGQAMDADDVTVNGQATDFSTSAPNFTKEIGLLEGMNEIIVVATDEAGNSVTRTRYVLMNETTPTLTIDPVEAVVDTPSVTISGLTEPGIRTVMLSWDSNEFSFPVEYDGKFMVTLTLGKGSYDGITVTVANEFGKTNSKDTDPFTIDPKAYFAEGEEEGGIQVQPMEFGALLAVIGITVLLVALVVTYYMTRHRA